MPALTAKGQMTPSAGIRSSVPKAASASQFPIRVKKLYSREEEKAAVGKYLAVKHRRIMREWSKMNQRSNGRGRS